MGTITDFLDERARKMLDDSVKLRALVRRLDAPTLHTWLNSAADMLAEAQKHYTRAHSDAEWAIVALESVAANGVDLPAPIVARIAAYRAEHPRKPFSEYQL